MLTPEGSWIVESLAIGGELQPPIGDGGLLTLQISGNSIGGSAGVNRFTGEIGGEKPFPMLATTMMAGSEELMAQEQIFLKHLQSVDSIEDADDGIFLVADGLIVVVLRPLGTLEDSTSS